MNVALGLLHTDKVGLPVMGWEPTLGFPHSIHLKDVTYHCPAGVFVLRWPPTKRKINDVRLGQI